MTRLIRWGHLANTHHVSVLWYDDQAERTRRTIVGGLSLEHIDGEPLPLEVSRLFGADMFGKWTYYQGVIQPAREALC